MLFRSVNAEVHAEEDAMKMRHTKEDLLVGTQGLPDPDTRVETTVEVVDPDTGEITEEVQVSYTGTLTEFAEGKYNEYDALVQQNRTEEASSNENLAITGYYQQLMSFISGQRASLADLQAQADGAEIMNFEDIQKIGRASCRERV